MANSSPRSTLLADGHGRSANQEELEEHIRALRRYAYALVGRSANADDLVQETLRRAISHLREGKEIHNLRSYLLTILHNVRNDNLKQEKRFGKTLPLDEDLELAVPAPQLRHIQCREVAEIIDTLPEDQREVLLLVGLEGTSYLDATEILRIPIGTVMSRLNRGRNAIRERLGFESRSGKRPSNDSQWNADRASDNHPTKEWSPNTEDRLLQARPDNLTSSAALPHPVETASSRVKASRRF